MKTSVKHNSVAWLSQFGTGDITFIPLAQSSSFSLEYENVTHKGIGSRGPVGYYPYKRDNVTFDMNVYASNERTFGTTLSRTNFATENYTSGDIMNYDLSGCQSAMYEISRSGQVFNMYSLYDDDSDLDLALTGYYSGFYCKFEDCLIENWSFSAEVGSVVSVDTSFSASDVSMVRSGITYDSGINEFYEAVRPQDIIVYFSSGEGFEVDQQDNTDRFNIQSLQINLPIQYKKIESFGSFKPSHRKMILPAVGSVSLKGIPTSFVEQSQSFVNQSDLCYNMTILVRSKVLAGNSSEGDYMVIKLPKLYLSQQSLDASVGSRIEMSLNFDFLEYGGEYASGEHGMYFLRKIPEEVTYFE